MDTSSMIMGRLHRVGRLDRVHPWAKLRRLREIEAQSAADTPDA